MVRGEVHAQWARVRWPEAAAAPWRHRSRADCGTGTAPRRLGVRSLWAARSGGSAARSGAGRCSGRWRGGVERVEPVALSKRRIVVAARPRRVAALRVLCRGRRRRSCRAGGRYQKADRRCGEAAARSVVGLAAVGAESVPAHAFARPPVLMRRRAGERVAQGGAAGRLPPRAGTSMTAQTGIGRHQTVSSGGGYACPAGAVTTGQAYPPLTLPSAATSYTRRAGVIAAT